MGLSSDLISQFAKITKDDKKVESEKTVYGTTVEYNGSIYAKLDGSDQLTPISTTTDMKPGERVTVMIKNHSATATGNISSPAARTDDVKDIGGKVEDIGNQITEFEIVIADKVSTKEFDAEKGRIDDLVSDNVLIKDTLTTNSADIGDLKVENATITETLTANSAEISNLKVNKLDTTIANATYATIENLSATNADIYNLRSVYGEFTALTTKNFTAVNGLIENLEANKLSVTDADIKYANIDFSNIGKAAIENFYATSGLIKDLVINEGTVTGELVGVTIKGDLIEGNTIKADKLVIKGSDGLYYKLNTDGITTEAEQTDQNSLNGSVIMAKSITATKISVSDLVAFDATIGGFNITNDSIYSGVKETATNTTRGVYLDKEGQLSVGDDVNFLRYFKDENGNYKLELSASSISMSSSGTTIDNEISNIKDELTVIKDEVTTVLRIESSRGTVFKNDQVSTVLSAVVYRGHQRITDMVTLKNVLGASSYLEWSWQRLNEESFGIISADDSRIGNDGFTFTLSPEDVDTKVTFMCQLIV